MGRVSSCNPSKRLLGFRSLLIENRAIDSPVQVVPKHPSTLVTQKRIG